jgi:hypothetical protein
VSYIQIENVRMSKQNASILNVEISVHIYWKTPS